MLRIEFHAAHGIPHGRRLTFQDSLPTVGAFLR
jgi:hypothetical protein